MVTSPATLDNPFMAPGSVSAWRVNRWLLPGGYDVMSCIFGLVLLAAAGLKAHTLYLKLNSTTGWSEAGHTFEVVIEWALASWILSGYAKAWARRATMIVLVIFVVVAGVLWLNGHEDCGCFGPLRVHPRWTFSFDVAAFIVLFVLGRSRLATSGISRVSRTGAIWRSALALALAVFVPALTFLLTGRQAFAADSKPIVVLEPLTWKGRPFPLLNLLDSSAPDLAHGRWAVILVDRSCHTCREYVARTNLDSIADAGPVHEGPRNVVLLDLATEFPKELNSFRVSIPVMGMKPEAVYLFNGPFLVFLSNGNVEKVLKPDEARSGRK